MSKKNFKITNNHKKKIEKIAETCRRTCGRPLFTHRQLLSCRTAALLYRLSF